MTNIILMFLLLSLPLCSLAHLLELHTLNYKSRGGSFLNITGHKISKDTGEISGDFIPMLQDKACKEYAVGKSFPIRGYYTGNALSITIAFPECGESVALIGNFDDQHNIETLWLDVWQGTQTSTKDSNTQIIGHDLFTLMNLHQSK